MKDKDSTLPPPPTHTPRHVPLPAPPPFRLSESRFSIFAYLVPQTRRPSSSSICWSKPLHPSSIFSNCSFPEPTSHFILMPPRSLDETLLINAPEHLTSLHGPPGVSKRSARIPSVVKTQQLDSWFRLPLNGPVSASAGIGQSRPQSLSRLFTPKCLCLMHPGPLTSDLRPSHL